MKIQDSYQCNSCQSYLSHPVDSCPVCGDQFYWLVETHTQPDEDMVDQYVLKMVEVVEGRGSREFMTHGEHLWLPHRFWDFDPSGESLEALSWVSGIKLHQHESENPRERVAEAFDTIPKMPLPKLDKRPLDDHEIPTVDKNSVRNRSSLDDTVTMPQGLPLVPPIEKAPVDDVDTAPQGMPVIQPDDPRVAPSAAGMRSTMTSRTPLDYDVEDEAPPPVEAKRAAPKEPLFPPQLLAPLMILIFFLFLSASYFVLRYHKNTNHAVDAQGVTHEDQVLP